MSLIEEFDEAMLDIYRRALSDAKYNATRYLTLLNERGGLGTARYLIHSQAVSEGYKALWERKHLNLTVEAMILGNPRWHSLFSAEELETCKSRLTDYGYFSS